MLRKPILPTCAIAAVNQLHFQPAYKSRYNLKFYKYCNGKTGNNQQLAAPQAFHRKLRSIKQEIGDGY